MSCGQARQHLLSTKGREERQLQHLFVREGSRRVAKNGNGNFFLSTKGLEGPRRTATATPFCPRRAAKGHEELQLQLLFVHEGPLRTTKNCNGNTFCPRRAAKGHEGPRRTATATPFCPRRATKKGHMKEGHEERQRQHLFDSRRAAKNTYIGPDGAAKYTFFGPQRAAKNAFGAVRDTFLMGEGHFLLPFLGKGGSLSMEFC